MAKTYLQTLIPLLSLSALLLVSADFSSTDFAAGEFVFQGDVSVLPKGEVCLTKLGREGPERNSVGRVVWSEPIQFSSNGQQLSFETTVSFTLIPADSQPAEGIAFFIAPVGTTIPEGSTGGYLGVFNPEGTNPYTLAIEFDAHYNSEIDQATMPHIGIDIESPRSSNFTYVGSAMIAQLVTATIRYSHEARLISVRLNAGNQVFEVSYVRDLSTLLPSLAQIGISGATGENVAWHFLNFWEFRAIGYVPISST